MNVTSKITVDLTRQNVGQRVNAVQGDGNTRYAEITLLSGGAPWTPPDGVEAAIAYMQPGGTKGMYNLLADGTAAISITGNVATVILAPQMLTASGTVQASLVFNDAALNRLTTFPFAVSVASNPAAGAQKVEDYIRLQWLEDKLDEYLRKAADSGAFDGKPGADGHTPEYGVDYGTPEQISGIAHQAAEILQPEVNQIKCDLSDLAPAGAAVGQLFRVAAISEDGKYTMEPVDMLDVQINGKSIVQDGVAIIPAATSTVPGVTAFGTGLTILGSKTSVAFAGSNDIKNRYSGYAAIRPAGMDDLLITAMCDGKGKAWTDTERIAALLRMGCTVDDNGFVKWAAQEVAE